MIRIGGTAGAHRAPSVRRILLGSCAAVAVAGIMLLAAPFAGPGPARAQFNIGGFHISVGGYGHWRRGRRSSRYARRHRGRDRDNDETPEPDTGGGPSSTARATSTPPADSGTGIRPASAPSEPRPASGRPEPRGPNLEPSN